MGDGFSQNYGIFFQSNDARVGDGFSCNDGTFFQGTDVTVGDNFAPLGPPFLYWENGMGMGKTLKQTS